MIQRLWVKDLRNINELHLDIKPYSHCYIYGKNNQGKTSILEALYLSTRAESPIQDDRSKLVQEGKTEALVGVDIDDDESNRLYCKVDNLGKRSLFVNNKKVGSFKTLNDFIYIDYICADILHFFQKDAGFRRKHLDQFCNAYFDDYADIHKQYDTVLKQKNRYLKQDKCDPKMLEIYNSQLVEKGLPLLKSRLKACSFIGEKLEKKAADMGIMNIENLNLNYIKKRLEQYSLDDYEDAWKKQLVLDQQKEQILGYTLSGPQRDDLELTINNKKVSDYSSRGINRMMAFLFKLSCIDLVKEKCGQNCCLLLDDTLAEIDRDNKEKMIQLFLSYDQVIFVTTEKNDYDYFSNTALFCIDEGKLEVCMN